MSSFHFPNWLFFQRQLGFTLIFPWLPKEQITCSMSLLQRRGSQKGKIHLTRAGLPHPGAWGAAGLGCSKGNLTEKHRKTKPPSCCCCHGTRGMERDKEGHRDGHGRDRQHVLSQGRWGVQTPRDPWGSQGSSALTLGWTCCRLESVTTPQEMLGCHLPRSVVFVVAVTISKYYYFQFLDKVWE